VLTEITNLLSDFHSSLKSIESKPAPDGALVRDELDKVNHQLESVGQKLNTDQVLFEIAKANMLLENVREKLNADTLPVEMNKISQLLDAMTVSLSGMDTKLVANNVNYSGVRYEIDRLSSSLGDIYNSVESLKGVNARDNAEIDSIKDMIRDITLSLDALLRKNNSISESIVLTSTDREIMEGRIRSELENIQNMISGLGASSGASAELLDKLDGIRKSMSSATSKVARNQTRIDKSIKDFNAYLTRLNSIDYMLRLLQAKQLLKTKRRLPKWARDKKKSIEALISAIEDEVADIMIVNAIPKEGLDAGLLSKAIGRTRKKTIERLVQLMASGYVDERKVKRKKFYFLVS
jgi:chromosome segregation ATPase